MSLKNKAYNYIKSNIIKNEFKPGSFLIEKEIADILEISKTPVREAFSQLDEEGWVKIVPRKGVVVTDVSYKDIFDIFHLRELFEIAMLDEICDTLDRRKLLEFKSIFENVDQLSSEELNAYDDEFHSFLIYSTENRFIIDIFKKIFEMIQRLRFLEKKEHERIQEAAREHLDIIDSLLKHDVANSKLYLKRHVENSKKEFLKIKN